MSMWSTESCLSGLLGMATYVVDSCEIKPGCCGFKVSSAVKSGYFAYYKITPPHANVDVRIVMTSSYDNLELYAQGGTQLPDTHLYDIKSPAAKSPWFIVFDHRKMNCQALLNGTTTCDPILVGVYGRGSVTMGNVPSEGQMLFDLYSYAEPYFSDFSCSDVGRNVAAGSKCDLIGLRRIGSAAIAAANPLPSLYQVRNRIDIIESMALNLLTQ